MKVPKKAIAALISFLVLLITSLLGTTIYRPYIYSNQLFDCHLADSHTSLLCVPVVYSLGVFISEIRCRPLRNKYLPIVYCAIGFYVYEILELFTGGFDWYDCIAIAIGALLTAGVVRLTDKTA